MWLRCSTCPRPYCPACALAEPARSSTSAASLDGSPLPVQAPTTSASTASKLSQVLRAEIRQFGVRVVLIEPTGVRNTGFVEAQLPARRSDAEDDPYGVFKRRYAETTRALAKNHLVTIDADTVARAVVRAVEAKNPKPRYIVGASGKASVLARLLLSDRMWDRVMTKSLNA
jgi:short-subunit dehydrogenase